MTNADIAIFRDLNNLNMNKINGKVKCTYEDSTKTLRTPVCPHALGALETAAEFKHDNNKWISEFNIVMMKMLMNGYTSIDCPDAACRLTKNI